jgi:hypothetical protein
MSPPRADQQSIAADALTAQPRGLLPVPPAVAEHVEREARRAEKEFGFQLTPEARQRMLHQGTLDWFYRDQWVTYRDTPLGVEILAVGLEEVGALAQKLTPEQRTTLTTKQV